jgi:hypothetical protein
MKPTIKEIEEYMAGLNGTSASDFNVIQEYNSVSKPKHYMLFDEDTVVFFADNSKGIEVRDVIEQLSWKLYQSGQCSETPLFISDYVQLMQYLMRFMAKNGKEDLEKARWYLDKMISAY